MELYNKVVIIEQCDLLPSKIRRKSHGMHYSLLCVPETLTINEIHQHIKFKMGKIILILNPKIILMTRLICLELLKFIQSSIIYNHATCIS